MIAKVKKAVKASQGAWRLFLAWSVSSPRDGAEDGRPKPRKSREASVAMVPVTMNGRRVSVATMALGSMWRNMMVQLETPKARAARTYSKFRARRNSARTTPTSAGHPKRMEIATRSQKLRPRIAKRMMIT